MSKEAHPAQVFFWIVGAVGIIVGGVWTAFVYFDDPPVNDAPTAPIQVYSPLDAATTNMVRDRAEAAGLAIEFRGNEVGASGVEDLLGQVRRDWGLGRPGDVILGGSAHRHQTVADLLQLVDTAVVAAPHPVHGPRWVGWYRGWVGLVLDSGVATTLGLANHRTIRWDSLIVAFERLLEHNGDRGLVFPDPSLGGSPSLITHAVLETLEEREVLSSPAPSSPWLDRLRATILCNSGNQGEGLKMIGNGNASATINWAHDLRREMDKESLPGLVGPIILIRTPWEVGAVSLVSSNRQEVATVYRFIDVLLSDTMQRQHASTGLRYPIADDAFAPNGLPPWRDIAPYIASDINKVMRRPDFRTRLDTLTAKLQIGACDLSR